MSKTKPTVSGAVDEPKSVVSVFDLLPDSAFVREAQLVQSPKRPGAPVPLPFSAPTMWRGVAAGTFPKPVKLSERVTCWRVGDIRAWMNSQVAQHYEPSHIAKKLNNSISVTVSNGVKK